MLLIAMAVYRSLPGFAAVLVGAAALAWSGLALLQYARGRHLRRARVGGLEAKPSAEGAARGVLAAVVPALAFLTLASSLLPTAVWNAHSVDSRLARVAEEIEAQSDALASQAKVLASALESSASELRNASVDEWFLDTTRRLPSRSLATSFLLLRPDGTVEASSGPDLRHLPTPGLEDDDFAVASSVTAITRFARSSLSDASGRFVIAARSDSTSRLPLAVFDERPSRRRERVWSLRRVADLESDSLDDSWFERRVAEAHLLRVRRDAETRRVPPQAVGWALPIIFFGFTMVAVKRPLAVALPGRSAWRREYRQVVLLASVSSAAALLAWWLAAGGTRLLYVAPALVGTALLLALLLFDLRPPGAGLTRALASGGLALACSGSIGLFFAADGVAALDSLSGSILASADVWALRCGVGFLFWGTVLLGARWLRAGSVSTAGPELAPLAAGAVIVLYATQVVVPLAQVARVGLAAVSVVLLMLVASKMKGWTVRLLLLAASAALGLLLAVELQRHGLREALAENVFGAERVIDAQSAEEFARTVDSSWRELELVDLAVGHPESLSHTGDLALALWEASPLAEVAGLSAVAVFDPQGQVLSTFSYGLPLEQGAAELDLASRRWPDGQFDDWWSNAIASFETEFFVDGRFWATAKAWLLPLMHPKSGNWQAEGGAVATDLLLGSRLEAWELPENGSLVLHSYPAEGFEDSPSQRRRIGVGPWYRSAPVQPGSAASVLGTTLEWERVGWGHWVLRRELPRLRATAVLAAGSGHLGTHFIEGLLPAAAVVAALSLSVVLAGLGLLIASPALRFAARGALLSYSRKLTFVVVGLAVVPLALFNVFLFQSAQQRSTVDQRKAGETGLRASERLLAEYLPTIRPGYSLTSIFEDGLLDWLPVVIGSELNLYWRGEVTASSRPELTFAGLIPLTVPSEVEAALSRSGADLAVRERQTAGGARHFEIYKRLALGQPGTAQDSGLVLSIPLLGQGRDSAEQFESLAQQSLIFTVLLLLVLVSVARRLARNFSRPIEDIVMGTARISEGASRLDLEPREPELAALVRAIDVMARRIATTRAALLGEKDLLEAVLRHVTSAVVAFDRTGAVAVSNPQARDLFQIAAGSSLDRQLHAPPLDTLEAGFFTDGEVRRTTLSFEPATNGGETEGPREFALVWVPTPELAELRGLLIAEDVTEVLRGQRLAAWAQMTRMIAHEIKNPLTPIRLSAEHLRRVRREQPARLNEVFEPCIENILEQAGELQRIAAEFSALHQVPVLETERADLRETVRAVVDGYRHGQEVQVTMVAAPEDQRPDAPLWVRHDERLVARILRNLVENAIAACARSARPGVVEVSCAAVDGEALVAVVDNGAGVELDSLERIFEPNFSTKSGGTGLGLAISRRIAEQHGGTLRARLAQPHGLVVSLRLPLADEA